MSENERCLSLVHTHSSHYRHVCRKPNAYPPEAVTRYEHHAEVRGCHTYPKTAVSSILPARLGRPALSVPQARSHASSPADDEPAYDRHLLSVRPHYLASSNQSLTIDFRRCSPIYLSVPSIPVLPSIHQRNPPNQLPLLLTTHRTPFLPVHVVRAPTITFSSCEGTLIQQSASSPLSASESPLLLVEAEEGQAWVAGGPVRSTSTATAAPCRPRWAVRAA